MYDTKDLILTREDWPSAAVIVSRNLTIQQPLDDSALSPRLLNFTDAMGTVALQSGVTLTFDGLAIFGISLGLLNIFVPNAFVKH